MAIKSLKTIELCIFHDKVDKDEANSSLVNILGSFSLSIHDKKRSKKKSEVLIDDKDIDKINEILNLRRTSSLKLVP